MHRIQSRTCDGHDARRRISKRIPASTRASTAVEQLVEAADVAVERGRNRIHLLGDARAA